MEKKNTAVIADLVLLIVAFIWGGGFIAGKLALTTLSPFVILAFRFLGSGLLIFLLFHKKMKNVPKETWKAGILIGMFMFLGMTIQTIALQHTTAGKQAFIVASYTVFVPFISWILTKKRPSLFAVLAGILTLVGVGILSLTNDLSLQLGDGLSLLFAFIFGTQIVCIGIFAKNVEIVSFTIIQLLTAGLLSAISAFVFAPHTIVIEKQALWGLVYLILFNTTIAFTLQNIAQRYTTDTHVSILLSLESIFGVLLSVLFLHEVFTLRMMLGAAFIFFAVFLSKYEKPKMSNTIAKEAATDYHS